MCSIAGEFRWEGRAQPLNLAAVRHRGPDGSGEWRSVDRTVWLGHTRLAVLELSTAGSQPMVDQLAGNVLVFNGEIYNHLQLRRQLDVPADTWTGHSDTETLLVGYRIWGRALLERLKGMFAFAIYDPRADSVFFARDRLGIKPLYFESISGGIRFASETRLLADSRRPLDPQAVSAYLQCGSCIDNCLPESGVQAVPAGGWMRVDKAGEIQAGRFWPADKIETVADADVPSQVRGWLETAVKEHMLADVPVASFLSGGIDSSVITGMSAQHCSRRLKTFSVGFPERSFDETAVAQIVANRFGTDHQRIELSDSEVLSFVREGVTRMDLPSVDAINTYIIAKSVRLAGVKVALSGLGGDELFGGYPSFRDVSRLCSMPAISRVWARSASRFIAPNHRVSDLPVNGDVGQMTVWRRSFFSTAELRQAGLPTEMIKPVAEPQLPDVFSRVSWHELTGYMGNMLLRDADQMSMSVSLELRVPFLDHHLVEGVLGLNAREKTRRPGIKSLLVEACRDLLPEEVYQRPKMGFALPMDAWMRGPLRDFVRAGVDAVTVSKLINRDFLSGLSSRFESGRLHWTRWWSVAVLGHYLARRVGQGRTTISPLVELGNCYPAAA